MSFAKYAAHDDVVAAERLANQEASDAGLEPHDRHAHVFIAMMVALANVPYAGKREDDENAEDETATPRRRGK